MKRASGVLQRVASARVCGSLRSATILALVSAFAAATTASVAQAQEAVSSGSTLPNEKSPPPSVLGPPMFSSGWFAGIKETLEIESGMTFNPGVGADGIDFGSLYTDRANVPLFNG